MPDSHCWSARGGLAPNAAHAAVISSAASRLKVVVEATNEEWVAATAAATLIHS